MITIYDSTLRDGEQQAGLTLSVADKLRITRRLDDLGIPYIEGGFPASNPKDEEFFSRVRSLDLAQARVVAFGSTCHKDAAAAEDAGLNAILASGAPAAAIVGKASDFQVTEVLRCSLEENLRMIADSVAYLRTGLDEVFFDAEHFFDGYKVAPDYVMEALATAVASGATTLVLCDTNGGTLPHEVYAVTKAVCERFADVPVAIHTHDDIGCADANSLEAVRAGATCVQGTINGYGERAGNADLITLIADLEFKMGLQCLQPVQMRQLTSVSQYVAETLNIAPDAHQPYVGANAFAHKGGLHAAAARRASSAYEHIDPELVGNRSHVVVSELSGRASLLTKAAELGVDLSADEAVLDDVLATIKEKENQGYTYETAEASLALLLRDRTGADVAHFSLESFRVIADKREDGRVMTEATVKIHVGDERYIATGEGNGPVNALDNALRIAITRFYPQIAAIELTDYKVRVLDESLGTDAVTRVLIESGNGSSSWGTVGVSENVIEASWDALVDAIEYGLTLSAGEERE